jgi:hypothetical protein
MADAPVIEARPSELFSFAAGSSRRMLDLLARSTAAELTGSGSGWHMRHRA